MTKLTERLRAYKGDNFEATHCYNGLRDEAANRIEELEAALREARDLLAEYANASGTYCEECDRHAPKNEEGLVIGPVHHAATCPITCFTDALEGGDDG